MAFSPHVKINSHRVRINDCDEGEVIKTIQVPTKKAYLYYIIYMEIQTSGSLRDGEAIKIGGIEFVVGKMSEGHYQISTSEMRAGKFEMWQMEMLVEQVNCKL